MSMHFIGKNDERFSLSNEGWRERLRAAYRHGWKSPHLDKIKDWPDELEGLEHIYEYVVKQIEDNEAKDLAKALQKAYDESDIGTYCLPSKFLDFIEFVKLGTFEVH